MLVFQTNTFQGVIITDSVHTYYVFSFTCGEIEWSGQGFETAIVGYNSNGDYFINHPTNGFSDIGEIISCTIHTLSEGRRKKRQNVMNPDGTIPAGECPADQAIQERKQSCIELALSDDFFIENFDDLKDFNNQDWTILSKCPQTKDKLIISPEFKPFLLQTSDCHRSKKPFVPGGSVQRHYEFVSVCCYNEING